MTKSYNKLPKPCLTFAAAFAAFVALAAIVAYVVYDPEAELGILRAAIPELPARKSVFSVLVIVSAGAAIATSWYAYKSFHDGAWQGPAPSKSSIYGHARILSKPSQLKRRFKVWRAGEPGIPGIVVGGIGSDRDKLLVADIDHALLEGATKSGKTTSVLLPTLLCLISAGKSIMALDPKNELYSITAQAALDAGYRVLVVDFADPMCSDSWNMLQPAIQCATGANGRSKHGIMGEVRMIAETLVQQGGGNPMWSNAARMLLSGCAAYVAQVPGIPDTHRNLSTAIGLASMPQDDLIAVVSRMPPGPAKDMLAGIANVPEETFGGFKLQLLSSVAPFGDPSVSCALYGEGITPEDLVEGKTIVYVRFSSATSARDTLVTAFAEQMLGGLRRIAESSLGGSLPDDVYLLLEELPQCPRIPSLAKACAVARGQGIHVVACIQSRSMLRATYGPDAQGILDNLRFDLVLSVEDAKTREEISKTLGDYTTEELKKTTATNPLADGSGTQSVSYYRVPLISPAQLAQWNYETGHLIIEHGIPYACSSLPISKTWLGDELGLGGVEPDAAKRAALAPPREVRNPDPAPVWVFDTKAPEVQQAVAKEIEQAARTFDPRVM